MSVTRYVVTHVNREGMRTLSFAMQGRYTAATRAEAVRDLHNLQTNNTRERLDGVYGEQAFDSFEVRAAECYDDHHDPMTCWFDDDGEEHAQLCAGGGR